MANPAIKLFPVFLWDLQLGLNFFLALAENEFITNFVSIFSFLFLRAGLNEGKINEKEDEKKKRKTELKST